MDGIRKNITLSSIRDFATLQDLNLGVVMFGVVLFFFIGLGCSYFCWAAFKNLSEVKRRRQVAKEVGNPTPQNVGAHDAVSAWFGVIVFGSGAVFMFIFAISAI